MSDIKALDPALLKQYSAGFNADRANDDGGWWQMFANLVNKYGLVPKSAYPESANSRNSDAFKQYLNTKLREFASDLRDRHTAGTSLDELRGDGYFDCDTVRVDQLFGTEFTFDKAKGLEYGDCPSNHAMTLTGVNLDEDGRPNRWKVVKACAQIADHADHIDQRPVEQHVVPCRTDVAGVYAVIECRHHINHDYGHDEIEENAFLAITGHGTSFHHAFDVLMHQLLWPVPRVAFARGARKARGCIAKSEILVKHMRKEKAGRFSRPA